MRRGEKGVVSCSALKKEEEMKESRQCLEKALEGKSEDFRKAMMENLEKQLKDLH